MLKTFALLLTFLVSSLAQNQGPSVTGALASGSSSSPIRSSNVTSSASALTLAAAIPSGAVVGDICVFSYSGQNFYSTYSSGWTIEVATNQSYWNGTFFYKVLTSGDLTSGFSITTTGSASPMILIGVDLMPTVTTYVTTAYGENTTTPASVTVPALSGVSAGNVVLYVSSYRGSTVPTVSRGSLLQNVTTGTAGAGAVYWEKLLSGFSTAVTYNFPGTYSPQGYYNGYIAFN